jgi:hypothetical protein
MNPIINLSPKELRQAADIQERIGALQRDLARILGVSAPALPAAPFKQRIMSAAGRARIAAAARTRWAKFRRDNPSKARKAGRRKMSPAAKARLAAIARKRWAAAKAAGRSVL